MSNILENLKSKVTAIRGGKKYDLVNENRDFLAVGFVTLLAAFLRFWGLGSTPPGFSLKEAYIIDLLQRLDWNHLWLGSEFYRGGYVYLAFLFTKLFGLSVFNLRLLSAGIGTLTVFFSYLFIAKWFSKKIALFTSFLFAISSFHITISRLILPEVLLPLALLILFSLLTDAYRNKNIWHFGAAGFFAGLGFYTSPVFLFVPFIFIISGAYFTLKNKKFVTSYRQELLIAAIAFFAASLPYAVSFLQSPMAYLTYFGFNRSISQLVMNIGQIPMLLFVSTSREYFLNIGTEPLLDPFISVTAISGFLFALFSIQRRKYFFMITWLALFATYAAMKRGVQIVDLIGILPVLYAFSALILDYIMERWFTTFPYNKSARIIVVTIVSIFFALTTLYNYERYFVAYSNSRSVMVEFMASPSIPLK